MPIDTPLGQLMVTRWKELGVNQTEFAKRIGKHSALVQMVRVGRRHLAAEDIPRWGKALEFAGADLDRFTELAHLEHCPAFIQKRYERMRLQLQEAGKPPSKFTTRGAGNRKA